MWLDRLATGLSTGVAIDDFESTITAEGEAEKQGPRQAA